MMILMKENHCYPHLGMWKLDFNYSVIIYREYSDLPSSSKGTTHSYKYVEIAF